MLTKCKHTWHFIRKTIEDEYIYKCYKCGRTTIDPLEDEVEDD